MSTQEKVLIIAEIAQAHEGSLGILHSYIDALAAAGVDIIKLQVHLADAESSSQERFRVPFSYVDKSRLDYWRRMEFSKEEWRQIKKHCEDKRVEFLASPFSLAAFRLLEDIGIKRYKIASGEIDNFLMLDLIKRTGKEILISTGMSSYQEIEEVMEFLDYPREKIVLLQCTTRYPASPEEVGLNVLEEFKRRFRVRVGLSDHSGKIFPSLAAVSLGAQFIECHAVFDKRMFGPDASSSLTIDQFTTLTEGIRFIETMRNNPLNKDDSSPYEELRKMFGKALSAARDLNEGESLSQQDLEDRKPRSAGIAAKDYQKIVGKRIKQSVARGSFIKEEDVEQ